MNFIQNALFIFSIVNTLVIGFALLVIIFPIARYRGLYNKYILFPLVFSFGLGLNYFYMQTLSFLGIDWSIMTVLFVLTGFSLLTLLLKRDSIAEIFRIYKKKKRRWNYKKIIFIIIFCGYIVFSLSWASQTPFEFNDALTQNGFKANVFFHAGGIESEFLQTKALSFMNPGYPLLMVLNYVFIYSYLGSAVETAAKMLGPVFLIAHILSFYYFILSYR